MASHSSPPRSYRINLYSDTQTRPTRAMYEAMTTAEVGDEQSGLDPTTKALEHRVSTLLNTQAALFLPSGTMANLIAVTIHCQRRYATIAHPWAHVVVDEMGGMASMAGSLPITPNDSNPVFGIRSIQNLLNNHHLPPIGLLWLEQTFNAAGGKVVPYDHLSSLSDFARKQDLKIHLDGARLFNATATKAGGLLEHYGPLFDSIYVDFTKGLGCPIGSALAGSHDFINQAKVFKKIYGGAMRQSGVIAAAALYALDHHVNRLPRDHALATRLANRLSAIPSLRVTPPDTNMVFIERESGRLDLIDHLVNGLEREGIRTSTYVRDAQTVLRLVTHLDVSRTDIDTTADAISQLV